MEQDDSSARFSALISGTAASNMLQAGTFGQTQRHRGAGARESSPGAHGGQKTYRTLFGGLPSAQTNGALLTAPGDLIRRPYREPQRVSLPRAPEARSSSPLAPAEGEAMGEEQPPVRTPLWLEEWNQHPDTAERPRQRHTPGPEASTPSRGTQPREFVKLRTSKSMHQRSNVGVPCAEHQSSTSSGGTSLRSAGPEHFPHPTARARSVSVASFGPEEDITSIMMRGATDLRNAKYEVEELRRELGFLRSQLDSSKHEKEELVQRVKLVKEAARQGLETTSRSMEEIRVTMSGLKTQSDETFAFFAQAKAALPDVKELRDTVSDSIKGLEAILDEEGHLVEVTKTRAVLTELKSQCTKSGQVAEMLRDKLQSVGSDLIDARNRVTELENAQNADREALRSSSAQLSSANEQTQKLVEASKHRESELCEALVACAELERQLSDANACMERFSSSIKDKDKELEAMPHLQSEVLRLESLLAERDVKIAELEVLQVSFNSLNAVSVEQLEQIRSLESVIQARQESIAQLEARIVAKESQYQQSQDAVQSLSNELGGVTSHVKSLQSDVERKVQEVKTLEAKLEASRADMAECHQELNRRDQKIHELEVSYQVMEERYETQVVTAKCAQETQAELQERLIGAERQFMHDLESTKGNFKVEIATLEQQKAALEAKVADLEATMCTQREEMDTIRAHYDGRIAKQDETGRVQLELAEQRIGDMQATLEGARASVRSLEEQIVSGKQEIATLRQELRDARLPDPAHKEASDALTAQITALRQENTELVLRARSIDARYRTGDLNEEEKAFINTLVQTSQSIHEQELVSKGNELRRRDNVIKEQQARIQVLEGNLAKHLKAMSKPLALPVTTAENRSLIDPTAWAASDAGKSAPEMPEEDVKTTNIDNTVTARPTPAPVRPVARPPLAAVPQPDPNTKARAARTPARLRPHAPTGAPTAKSSPAQPKKLPLLTELSPLSSSPLEYPPPKTPAVRGPGAGASAQKKVPAIVSHAALKGNFRRLDTAMSDEIQDFNDKDSRKASPVGTPPGVSAAVRARGSKNGLGKRDRPADAVSPPESDRPSKHLRMSTRSRAAVHQDSPALKVGSTGGSIGAAHPRAFQRGDSTQTKYKARKRRNRPVDMND